MDLVELYAGPWQDFVARRSQLAAAARDAGDPGAAKKLKGLKKPTRGAWLVNLVSRYEGEQLAEVLQLGEELAQAHREADPQELRRLSRMRAAVVNSLAGRASALAAERGYAAPDTVRSEVAETLQAAMADPELAERVRAGTLETTVRAAGFGPVDLFAPAPVSGGAQAGTVAPVIPLRQTRVQPADDPVPATPPPAADAAEIRRVSRDLGRVEARLEQSRTRLEQAERAAAEALEAQATAQHRVDDIGVRLAALRSQLIDLEAESEGAGQSLADAEDDADQKAAECERARDEVAELTDAMTAAQERLAELGIAD